MWNGSEEQQWTRQNLPLLLVYKLPYVLVKPLKWVPNWFKMIYPHIGQRQYLQTCRPLKWQSQDNNADDGSAASVQLIVCSKQSLISPPLSLPLTRIQRAWWGVDLLRNAIQFVWIYPSCIIWSSIIPSLKVHSITSLPWRLHAVSHKKFVKFVIDTYMQVYMVLQPDNEAYLEQLL